MPETNHHDGAGQLARLGTKEISVWQQEHSNHEHIQELLGAYALDALSATERHLVREHLAHCEACRAELARLQLAVHALPLSVAPRTPAPELRERIRAAVTLESTRPPSTAGPAGTAAVPQPPSLSSSSQTAAPILPFPRWRRFAPWAAAAALLILCIGLLSSNLQLRQQAQQAPRIIALQASNGVPVQGRVIYLPDQHLAVLHVEQLPPLAANQVYEIWLIKDNTPAPAGVFTQAQTAYAIPADIHNYQLLALTVEPGPAGSPQPTSKPFALASLQSS